MCTGQFTPGIFSKQQICLNYFKDQYFFFSIYILTRMMDCMKTANSLRVLRLRVGGRKGKYGH